MISICSAIIISLLFLFVNGSHENTAEKLVVCHFKPQSLKRPGPHVFQLDDLDPTLCTHFIYHGSTIDEETHNIMMNDRFSGLTDEEINGLLNKTMSLRERNPNLKILLGTCCTNEETFGNNPLTEQMISNFKKIVVHTLQTYGFDGLYISGGDIRNYSLLASSLRQEFDKHGYILAKFDFTGSALTNDLAESHDLLIIGSYWNMKLTVTGMISSPQFLERTVEMHLGRGIPPEKLVVPIPAFSMSYVLCERNDSGVSAEICGPGSEGTSEAPKLILLYHELIMKMSNASEGWAVRRDNDTGMLYGYSNSNLWTGYEDYVSVRAKAQYIIEKNLGGGMIISVDNDDFVGLNEEGIAFPLTKALHEALRGH